MADITLTTTESNIVVDASNNIIQVSSTPTTIVVGEGSTVDNAQIRSALSNVTPILYDVSTGVFSFDANATFSGKTTDDLAEGITNLYFTAARARGNVSATTATGITYNSGTGVFSLASIPNSSLSTSAITINGTAVSLGGSRTLSTADIAENTNLYFTAARARGNVSAVDAGGLGSFTYSSATGAFTYTGPSDSDVRGLVSAANTATGHGNISYNSANGQFTFSRVTPANILSEVTAGNVKLKQYSETVFDAGNQFGNVTLNVANGSIQKLDLVGNVTGLAFTNVTAGSTVSLILRQDAIGFRRLNTTSFASNWTTWDFVGNNTTLTVDPLAYDILTVTYDGTNYFASLVNFDTPVIQNSQLANSNVIVNGVTIALGSSGNIDTFNSNVTVNGNLNVTGNLNYQNVTDLYVTDQKITLNSNAATNANVEIISNRPTATNTMLKWNEQSTRWEFTNNGTTYYAIATSTTDLAEGSNLWFTTARANSAIDNRLVGGTGISYTAGTIALDFTEFDTGNIAEGSNLWFTSARVRSNISVAENLTYSNSTGVIGMANSLANVNSVTAELGQNHTLTSDKTVIQSRVRNNASVVAANVDGLGFAIYDQSSGYVNGVNFPYITYSGTNEIKSLIFDGDCTTGSNVITITNIYDATGTAMAVSNVKQYYGFCEFPTAFGESTSFPEGTYVTSVSGSNVYMSANALATTTFYADLSVTGYSLGSFFPMARDAVTTLGLGMLSAYDDAFLGYPPGSATTIASVGTNRSSPFYGYPESGPVKADLTFPFDTANFSVASFSGGTLAKTDIGASKTVPAFTRGLTVGAGDLTSRGIGDKSVPTFGVNILWDGTANVSQEYASSTGVFPQILLRSFSDGTSQGISGNTAASWSAGGPRLLFINGNGNATDPILTTYALANQEIGKIGWTSTTAGSSTPSSLAPAAFITAISNKNQTTGPGDVGLYLVASPTAGSASTGQIGSSTARVMWAGHHKSNTIISAGSRTNGTAGDIYFAPGRQGSNQGNAVLMSEQIVTSSFGSPHWAKIGYDVPTSNTGAKLSITNGFNTTSARNGNITLVLDRNDNGVGFGSKEWAFKLRSGQTDLVLTEDDVIRTTFASGGNVSMNGNLTITGRHTYDRVYGEFFSNVDQTAANTTSAFAITLNNTGISSDTSIVDNSNITIAKAGIYNIQFSVQLSNGHNAEEDFDIWLRKNGTNVPNTNTQFTVTKDRSGNPGKSVAALNLLVDAAAGDVYQLMWAVTNTLVTIEAIPEQASPYARPATPSVIVTVTPVGA